MLGIDFDGDLEMVEIDLPQIVTISGVDYSAVVSDAMRSHSLDAAGFMPDADLSVTIRVSVLASVANGTKITHGGRVYRAENVVYSPCGTSYEIKCTSLVK